MKRILTIITTQFVPYGGLTTVAMNYYRHLDHKQFQMDFASTNDAPEGLKQELKVNKDTYHVLPGRKRILMYYKALKALCRSYDIVHIHANSATATIELKAAKAAGVKKRIIHIHNTTCSHMEVHKLLKPIFDKTYTDAIACSKAAGEWIFPDGRYLVLNNAIDLERYAFSEANRVEVREQLGINDSTVVIGHVGKIITQKNHKFLVQCFYRVHEKVSDSKLLLIGDGELREEIEQLVSAFGLTDSVIFTGMVNASEKYLSAMDCFVFPSIWEGLPLSVLEAQANGLPCILSDNVTREVNVTHNLVFLSIKKNQDFWAEKIMHSFIRDRKEASLRNRNLLSVEGYDIEKNVSDLEEIYFS